MWVVDFVSAVVGAIVIVVGGVVSRFCEPGLKFSRYRMFMLS